MNTSADSKSNGPSDTAPAASASASALSPFRHPIFRSVWIANVISQFGGTIQTVGAAWLMLLIAESAEMVTLVQASMTLPIVLFALLAGALADNFDRRVMMLIAQIFMLIVAVTLTAITALGMTTPWLLLALTFLIGCGHAFNGPAWQSSVGRMVPREDLPGAVALNSMGFNIARSAGPALGGMIVAALGATVAFLVNAISYLGIIGVLARWRPPPEDRPLPRERMRTAIQAGIRYVAMSPHLASTLLRAFVFGMGASAVTALMPLIARDLVGGGPVTFGLLLGSFGVGAVGGALASHRLRAGYTNETIVRIALLSFAVAAVLAGQSRWLLPTMLTMTVCGAAWLLALATFNATVQTSTPRWVVGRALSQYQVAAFGGIALGSWLWGIATGRFGLAVALSLAALVLGAGVLLGRRFAMRDTSQMDLSPASQWQAPEIALDIEARSGPVVITIEYRIREPDVLAFLRAMVERRRTRLRDGARRWSLLRDLSDPEIWIERFHFPTWLDYQQHSHRRTRDDAATAERIRALHAGPDRPVVRRRIEREVSAVSAVPPERMGDSLED